MNYKTIALLLFLLINLTIYGQEGEVREIEVIGYSQREIVPDELYYEVEISDYKEGREYIQLEELDRQFWKIVQELEISDERIEIDDTNSRKLEYRRRKSEVIRSKTYRVKFSEINDLDKFAIEVEKIKIERSGIADINYSRLEELEEELKIEATINAKSRAEKILSSIGEELGRAKQITELYQSGYQEYLLEQYLTIPRLVMNMERGMLGPNSGNVKFKKIKFRTTIKVIFEIK
ncbi:MAG: SIMPL domain-containing protein [Trichodesmium erythraeum GBRTRLIN201]|nr:SIMPL domain-containing protein [Trichodesmium erythraeum GBRTRLIN201]